MSNDIENLLKQIQLDNDLSPIQLDKLANHLLHERSSHGACRIFLALLNKQKSLSDENYKRICNIIIDHHEKAARENAIRILDLLIESKRKASDSCLRAVEIALQDQQSNILRLYASKMLCAIIRNQSDVPFSSSLLTTMSRALHDTSNNVRTHILEALKELIQNQPSVISQEIIDSVQLYLSKIYIDMNRNYNKCVFITSFFLDLLYRQHKIPNNLLEIFSKFLIIDVSGKNDRLLNCQASALLRLAIEKQLILGDLSEEILVNLSECWNSKSFENKDLLESCLRILCTLNERQLKLTKLNASLLKFYLIDTNLDDNLRSDLRLLFGRLCRISYVYLDDENSASLINDTIDLLIEGLDQQKFLRSSVYALSNIVSIEDNYLSIYPLQKFVLILNQADLDREIRQNACMILQLAIRKQLIITYNELDALENVLNDSNSTISLTALQAFEYLFENYLHNVDLIGSYVEKLCTFAIELIAKSNLIFTSNASRLLEIILKHHFKNKFSYEEIANLCLGLQRNVDPSIRLSIFKSIEQIISKQSDIPPYTRALLTLEKLTDDFLHREYIDCETFETKLVGYFHETNFEKKSIPINLLKAIQRILKTNNSSTHLEIIDILYQCAESNLKFPDELLETLLARFQKNRSEIFIRIFYIVMVQNGQSLTSKFLQEFENYVLQNSFSSKYIIEILKFLIKRDQLEINRDIVDTLIRLFNESKENEIRIVLIETLAYSLENLPTSIQLPVEQVLPLTENHFQSESSTKEMKYYCCLILNTLLKHHIVPSDETINCLTTYAQENSSSTINSSLREISLTLLNVYLRTNKESENTSRMKQIEEILNERTIEETLLQNRNPNDRLQAMKKLLSMTENPKRTLSKSMIRAIELSFDFDENCIGYKLIGIRILERLVDQLDFSQIRYLFVRINENQLTRPVIDLLRKFIDKRKSFSDQILCPLIDFVCQHPDTNFRDQVIDELEKLLGNQAISVDLLNQIQLEISFKDLRDSNKNSEQKHTAINRCLECLRNKYRLSINAIRSLEYLFENSVDLKSIEEQVFGLIEMCTRNGQTYPSSFLNCFSQLTKNKTLNQTRIVQLIDLLSTHTKQRITQEIFDNCEENISTEVLLKGTQDGCQLTSSMTHQLEELLRDPDQRLNTLKVLKNEVKHKLSLEENLIRVLENLIETNNRTLCQSILNVLKYLPTYQPTEAFFDNLGDLLKSHPFYPQIEGTLNQIIDFSLQIKLHFIQVFLTVDYIETDLDRQPVRFICRQLLCNDLLTKIYQHDKYEEFDQMEFLASLNSFEDRFSFSTYSVDRDDILTFFIENSSNLTLKNINTILILLKADRAALRILFLSSPKNLLKDLQIHWLYAMMNRYSHIKADKDIPLDCDQAEEIIDLLMRQLRMNVSLSEYFLQRIHHIEDFHHLIRFLKYLHEKQHLHEDMNLSAYFTQRDSQNIIAKDLFSWKIDIQTDLIHKQITRLCQSKNLTVFGDLKSTILAMVIRNWSFEALIEVLENKQDQPFELMMDSFFDSLTTMYNYRISSEYENDVKLILQSEKSQIWPTKTHQLAVKVSFDRDEQERTLKDLLDEIKKSVENDRQTNVSIENLEQDYRAIISAYDHDSQLHSMGKSIKNWSENDVKEWCVHYKRDPNEALISELICVIKRAIFLHNPKQQFEPRTIQILSLLLMLEASKQNFARLAQIRTGEGKSVIIAMFAAIQALNGHQVDIVTTSPLLAKRDAENKKTFYQMLNLTVGENGGAGTVKACYKNNIVYGNVNEFQFDILKDEYSLLGTRCGRRFDIAIVDEVDSMLIDDNSKICRLSSPIPAIDELKVVLTVIWQELNRTYERIVRIENQLYCILVPYRIDENGQIIVMQTAEADDDGKILQNPAEEQENFLKIEDPYLFIESHITNYVENKLLKPNENNEYLINLPKHLNSFVEQQISKWIYNAWQAKFAYQENIHYLITEEKNGKKSIVPIDYRNTGIVQTSTSWPDGLHQFLQIKHQLRISAENLTTNFLSNVAFFRRYRTNLFGLTGTLGSQDSKDLIHHIYDVDFVIIPPYKYTQFIPYPDRLCQLADGWLNDCIRSIYLEAKIHQRAVLVICETKVNATKIYEKLLEKDNQLKKMIKLYTRSDNEEQTAIENELDCGEIIVATNLAGRGTDIETTSKVEDNGGLHVLVTFLPLNTRVEDQAFGRTSRQGKRGTAQLVVFPAMENEKKYENMKELKNERDLKERYITNRARDIDLKNILQRDGLFQKFCRLRHDLRGQENDRYKLDSVEELWGLWLKITFAQEDSISETGTNDLTDDLIEKKFEEFCSRISQDYSSNKIFQNPFYLIFKANEYIFNMKRYDEGIELLQYAIQSDPIFSVSARYNFAYALIKKSTGNKAKAKLELEEALKTIENIFISQQQAMLISFGMNHNDEPRMKSDAEEQIYNRINLLYLCKNQIEQGIAIIEDAENKEHGLKLEYRVVDEFFSGINKPTLDINEFKESGFVGFFQLSVKEPTPWLSIIAVGIIGLAQAAAGAAIIAFSGGAAASLGSMLLSEGINDMIFAIKCGIMGEFSWKEYGIQKAISLTITIATCGLGALKETGQLIKSGFHGTAGVIRTATIGGMQLIGQFTKESWKLVGKQIVNAFVKQGAREIIQTVLDKTVLAELSQRLQQEISDKIEGKMNEEVNTNQTIHQCLVIDAALKRPHTHCQEIQRIAHRILHPQSNRFTQAALTIAKGIVNRLTNGKSGRLFQIITTGKCLTELVTFLENFLIELKKELEKCREQVRIDYLLHVNNSNDLDKRTAKEITESLRTEQYVGQDNIKVLKKLEAPTFKLNKHRHHEAYVMNICNTIYAHTETRDRSQYDFEKNLITKTLTDQLASYMTNRLNAELINPVVHGGVDAGVHYFSNKIERACADSRGTLEEQIQKRRAQNDIIQKGELLRKRTAEQQTKNEVVHPEIENLARGVENNTPGDLKSVIALSAKLGRPIQIHRNGRYDLTIGDTNTGDVLQINFGEGQMGDIGHYTGTSGNETIAVTGAKDCLFDTLSAQTGKSASELRALAATGIRENSDVYLKMMPSLHFLGESPDKTLLYIGGDNSKSDGTYRARRHERKRIENETGVTITGEVFEFEHPVSYAVLSGNVDSPKKIDRDSREGRRIENDGPAYAEQKDAHRHHVTTGYRTEGIQFNTCMRTLLKNGDVSAVLQMSSLEYAHTPNFAENALTSHGQIAHDSYEHMVLNIKAITYRSDDGSTVSVSLTKQDKMEALAARYTSETRSYPDEAKRNEMRDKIEGHLSRSADASENSKRYKTSV